MTDELLGRAERLLFEPDRGRPLYPGARELVMALRSHGLRIGLISNWSSHWIVTDIVTAAGIDEFFSPIVSSASFGRIKPHPSIFALVFAHALFQHATDRYEYLGYKVAGSLPCADWAQAVNMIYLRRAVISRSRRPASRAMALARTYR